MKVSDKPENPLAEVLWDYWTSDRPHHERLILTAAVISTALQKEGMRATLVGGGAIELHAPGIYRTGDIDLVVEGKTRHEFGAVLGSLGLQKSGRHWIRDDLYVEVPALSLELPADCRLGPTSCASPEKNGASVSGSRDFATGSSGAAGLRRSA